MIAQFLRAIGQFRIHIGGCLAVTCILNMIIWSVYNPFDHLTTDSFIHAIIESTKPSTKSLFVHYGILCMKEQTELRNAIRQSLSTQYSAISQKELENWDFTLTFVIGERNPTEKLSSESELHQDITILPINENMNNGKTYEWFNYAYRQSKGARDAYQNYMVFKADMDTIVCLDIFIEDLLKYQSSKYLYYGRTNGYEYCGRRHCPPKGCDGFYGDCWIYKSGGLYGMSMPLINAIFEDDLAASFKNGFEDIQVGLWINQTDVRTKVNSVHQENCVLWCHSDKVMEGWNAINVEQCCAGNWSSGCK